MNWHEPLPVTRRSWVNISGTANRHRTARELAKSGFCEEPACPDPHSSHDSSFTCTSLFSSLFSVIFTKSLFSVLTHLLNLLSLLLISCLSPVYSQSPPLFSAHSPQFSLTLFYTIQTILSLYKIYPIYL